MKRRTLRFIEKGSGTKVPFLARFTTKQIIIAALLLVAAISGVVAYLLYVRTFGNAAQIVLTEHESPGYEWEQIASENNIISNYLWGRTKKLMLGHDGEDIMIPTYYKIAGRLVTQPAEPGQKFRVGREHAAFALHGLNDHRAAAVGQQLLHAVKIIELREENAVHQRTERFLVMLISRKGQSTDGPAVEGLLHGDDLMPARSVFRK